MAAMDSTTGTALIDAVDDPAIKEVESMDTGDGWADAVDAAATEVE